APDPRSIPQCPTRLSRHDPEPSRNSDTASDKSDRPDTAHRNCQPTSPNESLATPLLTITLCGEPAQTLNRRQANGKYTVGIFLIKKKKQ
ncbi:hypothetical protein, partial [Klebsiella pneumoniae]|uniref:hypothetical protein n=1 Tax=Klebsiella pneumoniae TaxID=573 RepID=UPI0019D6B4CE